MAVVEHRHVTTIEAPRCQVIAVLRQVDTYDRWLDFVHRVDRDATGSADPPAWYFTLRARIGPFARSKRLRVVETAKSADLGNDGVDRVRLERQERDGRDHAPWIFDAELTDCDPDDASDGMTGTATEVTLTLTYGGRLWTSALNPVLDHQLQAATRQLETLALTVQ